MDAHVIPPNPAKREPEHIHYDLRFLLVIDPLAGNSDVALQLEEVTDYRWAPLTELPGRLGDRTRAALLTQP
nr:hypothetical protein [Frankia sp. EI5c]